MKISELKTIAKENYYELKEEKEIEQITLERKVTFDGIISNVITISLIKKNLIFIRSKYCDDKDFNMKIGKKKLIDMKFFVKLI